MRTDLPEGMPAIWRSGDYTGDNRPIARVTLQQSNVNLYDYELTTNSAGVDAHGQGVGDIINGNTVGSFTAPLRVAARGLAAGAATNSAATSGGSDSGTLIGFDISTGVVPSVQTQARQSSGTVHETYASIIFGSSAIPKELPNVASVQWTRSIDQDFAQCTIKFYNTAPMPIGTAPTRDLDMPGYYTYNRGRSSFSNRWGQTPNDWSALLMPDNIIRTFEGYGCDPTAIPEKDSHLMQSGMWRIDQVQYTHDGIITVTCRDVGSILGDQIIFAPVVPPDFYPVSFAASTHHVGLVAPKTYTYSKDSSGAADPNHPAPPGWTGPTAGVSFVSVVPGSRSIAVTWDNIDTSGYVAGDTVKGYTVPYYRIVLDGVILPAKIKPSTGTTTTAHVPAADIVNGNVYSVQVVPTYKEKLTKKGEVHFKTNVERQQDGVWSESIVTRPGVTGAPTVGVNSINLNQDAALDENPGWVSWQFAHGAGATWKVIAYQVGSKEQYTYTTTSSLDTSAAAVFVGDDIENLTQWNFLVFGTAGGNVGPGDVHFATSGGGYFGAPTSGAPAHDPGPAPSAPTVTVKTSGSGGGKATVPISAKELKVKYDDSSNSYPLTHTVVSGDTLWDLAAHYLGDATKYEAIYQLNKDKIVRVAREHGFTSDFPHWIFPGEVLKIPASFGHTPQDAFDGSTSSFWLSSGHARADQASDFEWIQGQTDKVTLTQVKFNTLKSGYHCYVSVYAKGTWVSHNDGDKIPYSPAASDSDNHARIPYCEALTVDNTGQQTVTFRSPIPGATKIRLTFHNLQLLDSYIGSDTDRYRVGVQNVRAYGSGGTGSSSSGGGSGSGSTTTPAPVVAGPPQDDNDPDIVSTWTEYIPAHFDVGAGANPGQYNDYTDIIKLFASWGGFFWPEGAQVMLSDGSAVQWDFGTTDFGLANIDPVLGADGSGRCWGDFEQTGTAGPAAITVDNWDKKSLMDGISYVRDIIGFIFYVDEQGGIVWRQPNVYSPGNWVSSYSDDGARTSTIIDIDEKVTLIGLTATLGSGAVRERIFVATVDGSKGALARGWNPNPTGLRRVAGWTDMHFQSNAECQVMADLIALNQLFAYRTDSLTIPGYPAIQVDDQVRIFEQVTGEGYIHYVKGISSTLDMEGGSWTYRLDTHWLGENPGELWVFNTADLAEETQAYLNALKVPAGAALESDI